MEKQILEKVIDLAKKNGATADVIQSQTKSFTTKAHMNEIDNLQVSSSKKLGVRVIKDNKVGTSFSSALDNDSLETMVKQALNNAKYSKENAFEQIVSTGGDSIYDNEECNSSVEVDSQEIIDLTLDLERKIREKDSRVKNAPYNGVSETKSEVMYLNSNGRFAKEVSKSYGAVISSLMEDGDNNAMFYSSISERNFRDIKADQLLKDCFNHTASLLGAGTVKTGKYNVVFAQDMLPSLFGVFGNIFSAKATLEGHNPLKERLGETLAHKELTMIDSPLFKGGFSNQLVDSEGLPASDTVLLLDGQYHGLLQNSATSKELEMTNTHNASRSIGSALGVGRTNTVFSLGSTSEKDILEMDFVEIIKIDGLHSGANSTSGEFSFPVSGYLWRDGQRVQAIKGVTLSGNFFKSLNEISHIGDHLHANSSKNFFAPKIVFGELAIAGS